MTYTCKLCKEVQHVFVTDVKDEICLTCYYKIREEQGEQEEDMNKVEEYIQGDHGYVISSNY